MFGFITEPAAIAYEAGLLPLVMAVELDGRMVDCGWIEDGGEDD